MEGRKEGRKGRKEGRTGGQKEGRTDGQKEGRKEGRKGGQTDGRKAGREDSLRQLSWAQAAREAASLGMMPRSMVFSSLKSSRQVTRSMEGRDRMVRSDSMSRGAAAGMMG